MSDQAVAARSPRYRVNVKETAKGVVQVDCTAECEFPNDAVEQALRLMRETRLQLKDQGRVLADEG